MRENITMYNAKQLWCYKSFLYFKYIFLTQTILIIDKFSFVNLVMRIKNSTGKNVLFSSFFLLVFSKKEDWTFVFVFIVIYFKWSSIEYESLTKVPDFVFYCWNFVYYYQIYCFFMYFNVDVFWNIICSKNFYRN